ncbi:TPA: HK97 family phage prohead protease [Enterobacter bugandensis]|uniref:HK97 family phage prohead protease n=1 Tax=Enterobacter TaxID=547 RepID=UPI0024494A25|nr:HK97 family phage prohead protease [Enterobacter bugandensis]MDH0087756.1 HK97 family phage prohead protease [Enterobacter bugandensis]MDH0108837.1 HK97 family phage prohead protease [Enterobacter bugandensis]MDH0129606.1 HK97 family phage prohead protease [Enterobacter bugandensis]HDR2693175.1 HK97 family phage prohead protease [Enterobacter bugandensis]HDS3779387.1 HK97 family phage prohead protease [Enterobacter bugandensis]
MPDIIKTLSFEETEIKFAGDGQQGIFEGYASVFGNTDSDGDIILPGAFKKTLETQTRKVAMFFNHRQWEIPVGKWDSIQEDSKGLLVRGQLTPGHSGASDLKAAMIHGTVEGMSIGFSFTKDDYSIGVNGGYIFSNISWLKEISVCTFPANELAGVDSMKSIDGIETIRDVECWLRDSVGLSKSQAVGLIARFKSAIRSESEGDPNKPDISALLKSINDFNPTKGK